VQLPSSFRNMSVPPTGDAGLDELVRRGALRIATQADVRAWREFAQRTGRSPARPSLMDHEDLSGNPMRTFVVLGPMAFPGELFGAHSATFIVPRGTERPTGNPGHSSVLSYE
jgi:hypothetical protein